MELNLAVIGLGRWGPNHVRNFEAVPGCRVVAAADPVEASRQRIHAAYPHVQGVADYREVLARPDVQAVVVSTPTATHFAIVRDALMAGKHVLCEKPLTNKSAEAWALTRLAEEKGLALMVGHVFLFNGGVVYLADALEKQLAGKPYYVTAVRTNLGPFRYDVNAGWDLASHDIYIFNHLLGKRPLGITAVGASYLTPHVEDIVFLTLHYPDGVLGHIHVSWLDPKKVRTLTVVGEKKMITWDEFGQPGPIMIHDRSVVRDPNYNTFGEFQLLAREGDVVVPRVPLAEPLAAQARHFAALCAGKVPDQDRRGRARQGAEVVDILEASARSLAARGAQVEITYGDAAR